MAFEIPASMVERAARALRNDDFRHQFGDEEPYESCGGAASSSPCGGCDQCIREQWWFYASTLEGEARYRRMAITALAAALEGCEVGVEEGVQLIWPAGKVRVTEEWDRDHLSVRRRSSVELSRARELVDAHRRGAAGLDNRVVATMLHRYVITTPAETVERTD